MPIECTQHSSVLTWRCQRDRLHRGRIRRGGGWRRGNLRRLRRSLAKIAAARPAVNFAAADWAMLLQGYADAGDSSVEESL